LFTYILQYNIILRCRNHCSKW